MIIDKTEILNNLCYTELVYERINKKLKTQFGREEIREMIFRCIKESPEQSFQHVGKNYYILNGKEKIKITVNASTFRIITVDALKE